jgi:mono/diheme cytochrome c family protein
MGDGSYPKPFRPTNFFANHNSARPLVEGTVSRDGQYSDFYQYNRTDMSTSSDFAVSASADFPADFPRKGEALRRRLERGQERFNIYCSVCHGRTGAADGMIVQRGFVQPPAYYPVARDANVPDLMRREANLLKVPPGYIYDKITNGYGAMYSYAARVAPEDRWNIAAYIRVLQASQSVRTADLSPNDRAEVMKVSITKTHEANKGEAVGGNPEGKNTATTLPAIPATSQATEGRH